MNSDQNNPDEAVEPNYSKVLTCVFAHSCGGRTHKGASTDLRLGHRATAIAWNSAQALSKSGLIKSPSVLRFFSERAKLPLSQPHIAIRTSPHPHTQAMGRIIADQGRIDPTVLQPQNSLGEGQGAAFINGTDNGRFMVDLPPVSDVAILVAHGDVIFACLDEMLGDEVVLKALHPGDLVVVTVGTSEENNFSDWQKAIVSGDTAGFSEPF